MARILGVEIPNNKRIVIALTYLYGVGRHTSENIIKEVGLDPNVRTKELSDEDINKLATEIEKSYVVEGQLVRQLKQNIQRLREIQSNRGIRHRRGLPVRGQRTRCNARTRKGPRKTVAGKKRVGKH